MAEQVNKGLEGVIAAQTALSHVDGENSQLYYLGIPIHEFVKSSNFEEVVYLLRNSRLPNKTELRNFKGELSSFRDLEDDILDILEELPRDAHPMAVLKTMVSVVGLFDPEAEITNLEHKRRKALRLTAVFPTIIAAFYRFRNGEKPIAPNPELSHAANFLYMMHGKPPEKEMEKALDAYLILLADHGLNASTFAARVTISTQSDIYSAVTSAVGTLKGDLHGSANQRVMEMLRTVGDPKKAEKYVLDKLAKKEKIMGFGHRIYKTKDPRAEAFHEIAKDMCERAGDKRWMEIAKIMEKVVWEQKKIPANVDFYSAPVLYVLGFPIDFFTTVFAASRVAGWTSHVIEQFSDNRLIRPAATYTGPSDQSYTPIEKRR